jgi:hypothetical protein
MLMQMWPEGDEDTRVSKKWMPVFYPRLLQ